MRTANLFLLSIFLGALTIRLICALLFYGLIDTEGAEYARIAQNLMAGNGYSGIATGGVQLFFAPMFPILIATAALFTDNAEIAGRGLNILFGSLLVFPIYLIARQLFELGTALWGAVIVAIHPYLIFMSTGANCEPTYLPILLTAMYCTMRVGSNLSIRSAAVAGILYGLAFLIRQEALAFMLVAFVFIFMRRRHWTRRGLITIVLAAACFSLVATPYVGWLSSKTGTFRIEAKSSLNVATELRIQRGMTIDEAAFAIDKDGTAAGVWIQPNINIVGAPKPNFGQLATMMLRKTNDVVKNAIANLTGKPALGYPAIFALAVLGLFGRPWSAHNAFDQMHLIAGGILAIFGTYFIYYSDLRFYIYILVVQCIWASAGIMAISEWAAKSAAVFHLNDKSRRRAGTLVQIVAVSVVFALAAVPAYAAFKWSYASRIIRILAVELGTGAELRIADTSAPFAYHANADLVWLPYCEEGVALSFLRRERVTHVVINQQVLDSRPYLRKWFEEGVPDAHEVSVAPSTKAAGVRVFKFHSVRS